jgi:hypothetical protein
VQLPIMEGAQGRLMAEFWNTATLSAIGYRRFAATAIPTRPARSLARVHASRP